MNASVSWALNPQPQKEKTKMRIFKSIALVVALIVALSSGAFAQTTTSQSSLSAAITSLTTQSFTVTSASGCTASTQAQEYFIWYDGEYSKIQSVSGTTITVALRGDRGTRATTHPSGGLTYCGPSGPQTPFVNQNPAPGTSCTATQYQYLPILNWLTGDLSHCRNSRWVSTNLLSPAKPGGVTGITTTFTATLADYIIGYTAVAAAYTVTLPDATAGNRGKVYIIQNQSGVNTLTVWLAGTAINGSSANLSIPIYGLAGASFNTGIPSSSGSYRVVSNGSGWYAW
jgi:hypothetical protein